MWLRRKSKTSWRRPRLSHSRLCTATPYRCVELLRDACLSGWLSVCLAGWLSVWLAGWLAGWLAVSLSLSLSLCLSVSRSLSVCCTSPPPLIVFLSLQSVLVAIVVPDEEFLVPWAQKEGIAGSFNDLCSNPKVASIILKEMTTVGRAHKLKGFELPRAVHLEPVLFSTENGLLTPTFKLKRVPARDHYRAVIDSLYASLSGAGPRSKL